MSNDARVQRLTREVLVNTNPEPPDLVRTVWAVAMVVVIAASAAAVFGPRPDGEQIAIAPVVDRTSASAAKPERRDATKTRAAESR